MNFRVVSSFEPSGDQPKVIEEVSEKLREGSRYETVLGATGTGKTYVMAKIVEKLNRPALVICHNKTLAAQLYKEFKEFFPDNAVEYFVSYYDYYQPEAYVVKKDLYIEKDSQINDEIEKLRLRATASLMDRKDVLIVASVSCIYGLGSPEDYENLYLKLERGAPLSRSNAIKALVDMLYERNDANLTRGHFRARGDVLDLCPSYETDVGYRIEFFGDEIERLTLFDVLNNSVIKEIDSVFVYPAKHFVVPQEKINRAVKLIEEELEEQLAFFEREGHLLEKQRIESRTRYDIEMLQNTGFCSGIENYSRHLTGRKKGESPWTLIDYFPDNFLTFVDESHVTLPQIGGMHNGDQSRKKSLVDYGFRLPSALDNRPLKLDEFFEKSRQTIFISATPGPLEAQKSPSPHELIIRPTGLLDPVIEVRRTEGQVDDLLWEVRKTIEKGYRVFITTLTKKMSEDLSEYLKENKVKTKYLHSDIDTIERVEILTALRRGDIDVIVGINLLREGLDVPEVALVAIMDADKIGFLRSKTALIQTVGRAARNVDGRVLMYADRMSDAMRDCIEETNRRRQIQEAYNRERGITPKTIVKKVDDVLGVATKEQKENAKARAAKVPSGKDLKSLVKKLEFEMELAADNLDFEKAIDLREEINFLKKKGKL